MKSTLKLILRMLARDWRAGELTVVSLALLLATTALTSVAFLSDRVERGLAQESHQLLGGDLLLTADHPWPASWGDQIAQDGLRLARSSSFISMVSGNGATQLADVKAVSDGYPLRGKLRTAPALNQPDHEAAGIPPAGTVWGDERLAAALGIRTGDSLRVGALTLRFDAVLTMEPDRGFNVFSLAPRLMLNEADLAATGLLQEGSRVSYRLHLAGEADAVARFQAAVEPRLGRGERLETLDNARPEIRNVMDRSQRFLRLAALLSVVLAAVAVALATQRYVRRHLDGCAVMRCLGASGFRLLAIHGGEFLLLGALITLFGCLLGYVVQLGLQQLLAVVLRQSLPPAGPMPWLQGAAITMTLVAGFALPPLLRLRRVSTLRVLRREWESTEPLAWTAWGLGAIMLAALMLWVAGELRLWLVVLGGFLAAVAVYAILARGILGLLGLLRHSSTGPGWRYGIASLRRRMGTTLIQSVALALAMTALLLLTVARGDLLMAWQSRVPADAPNRFVINIQPDQLQSLKEFFVRHDQPVPVLEPMVRGRLVAVNGRPVVPEDYAEDRARRLVDREFNLSWSEHLPEGNRVVSGQWHGAGSPQFSVEQGLAETLGLVVGDELTYDIAGTRLSARITSLRKLDWDSMRVNFFVITPPGALQDFPASYLSSFYLPPTQGRFVPELVRAFPNLTVVDVAAIVRQLQDTIAEVVRAVQAVFGFALLAGLVVLHAALQAGADERAREIAVLRALGARQSQLRAAMIMEFALLGAIAGGLAGGGTAMVSFALARWAFHLPYEMNPLLPAIGLGAGIVLSLLAGWLGSRPALRGSPLAVLRAAS